MHKRFLLSVSIFLLINVYFLNGQKLINSPYARFNLGILNQPGAFRSLAMGGIGVAMRDNNTVAFTNPASYSAFDTSSFVFDMGMDLSLLKLLAANSSFKTTDMNFRHILLGFPVGKKIGLAAGLVPYSNGYYYIAEKIIKGHPNWNELTGNYSSNHMGKGSFTTLFAGSGIELFKNFSAGINMTILFGNLERQNHIDLADYNSSFSLRSVENLSLTGFNLDYGLQYAGTIKKDYFFNAGVSFSASKNYKSTHELLKQRYTLYIYPPYTPDTLANFKYTSTDSTRSPNTLRFGLLFGKKEKFSAGIEYVMTGWNNAKIHGSDALMASTQSLMVGIEYIPEKYSNTSFLRRIEYRAGVHVSDNYLILNGIQLKEYGISGGLAIRIRNSVSKASVYIDYTRRAGDLSKGLHNENIFSAGISLNLYDYWFIKRKYE